MNSLKNSCVEISSLSEEKNREVNKKRRMRHASHKAVQIKKGSLFFVCKARASSLPLSLFLSLSLSLHTKREEFHPWWRTTTRGIPEVGIRVTTTSAEKK